MNELWLGFIGGLVSFVHCAGMCGGFVLHLSRGRSRRSVAASLTLWHTGRIFTYVFLGAVAGYAGAGMDRFLRHSWMQDALAWAAGAIILLMGCAMMGLLSRAESGARNGSLLAPLVANAFFPTATPSTALVLGITTGCLPCPIVVGFLAYALNAASVPSGIAIMTGMGMGTLIPLLLVGAVGVVLSQHLRRWGRIFAAILLVLLGITTMARGTSTFHRLLGCNPAVSGAATDTHAGCCPKGTVPSERR